MSSDELSETNVAELLEILSKLIKHSNLNNKTKSGHEQAVLDVISNICNGARTDGGGRLTKQANIHAMDSRIPSIIDATGDILFYEQGLYMH